jgi:hypothetical protein
MDLVLRDLTGPKFYVFIDDVIVYADTNEVHVRRLAHMLQIFERAILHLQPEKCVFS